jgi:hypothetical protein
MCGRRKDVHDGIGNEIPATPDARFAGFPFRRVAGLLAGRLGKRPAVLSRDGRKSPALSVGCFATGGRTEPSAYSVSMPKPPKVVSIQKETNKAKLIAKDEKVQRVIIGIGSQRIAYDFHTRITHLPPETGDQPAEVLPMTKASKKGTA